MDDLLNMATDTGEPNTVMRKPKHKTVRLATHSNGTDAVKRKCQRAMLAGKGTSSGKSQLFSLISNLPRLRELAFTASFCMTRILDGDGAEELRQPDVSLV